jgi:hypothetical protein
MTTCDLTKRYCCKKNNVRNWMKANANSNTYVQEAVKAVKPYIITIKSFERVKEFFYN